jgi:predicted TIM-barrel fold metal-dependent hydrolase
MWQGYRVYDADAHVMMSPRMWEDLPREYALRRPRPVRIGDAEALGRWDTAWLLDGQIEPRVYGPGAQGANIPADVLPDYGAPAARVGAADLSDPQARLDDLDRLGIDVQFLFPTTLYACMSPDPSFEAAMFRAYNRYMSRQCGHDSRRLKWAALLPLRDPAQGCAAIREMQALGASAAVVYGTARERLLSDPSFTPLWDEFAGTGLPLIVHMGRSYPGFDLVGETSLDTHMVGLVLPVILSFVAIVGHGMLDRYPDLKVAFLEFGAEWIFYTVGRMDHYLPSHRYFPSAAMGRIPRQRIVDYVGSGRIFLGGESDDPWMLQEIALVGEDQLVFSSDYPHGEGRDDSLAELLGREDLSENQKRKILYANAIRLYGEP